MNEGDKSEAQPGQEARSPAGTRPSEAELMNFRLSLRRLSKQEILTARDNGLYGHYDRTDSSNSDPRVWEANRRLKEIERWEELRPQWIGIILATILGVAALVVAILSYVKQVN